MKWLIYVLSLSLLTCCTRKRSEYNVIGCSIYDSKGTTVREFGGGVCLFLPDGSYILGLFEDQKLYRADRFDKILWTDDQQVHHQLNTDLKGRHFLLMTGNIHKYLGKKVRFDRLEVRDFDNHTVHSFDFFDRREELLKLADVKRPRVHEVKWPAHPAAPWKLAHWEFSHANSFYQIPQNAMAARIPAFKKGGYIVNINSLGLVMILDNKLEKILWHMRQTPNHKGRSSYHDVQVLPSGRLLIYNNFAFAPQEKAGFHSAAWEVDPLTGATVTLYEGNPWSDFASPMVGGAQILANGNLLLSDISKGGRAFEVNPKRKIVWQMRNPHVDPGTRLPLNFHQVKRLDLSEFLKNNRSL